jgi:UDP-glucose 4-epimerase
MRVLVTGGAGYIGSHMVFALIERGDDVVVLDDLSTGSRELVSKDARLIVGDAGDRSLTERLLREADIEAVIHFAGSVVVPESVADPLRYYANNTEVSRKLVASCVACGVRAFIFSSTAAVYGIPDTVPVSERAATAPINPYGRSKLMTEWILEDAARAYGLPYAALRYFNVAGADPHGRTGQSSPRATHLIKRACQVAVGRLGNLEIFGTDFPTPDGTGVRDYIHVSDLITAHILALDQLLAGAPPLCANVGYGSGYSVLEVIAAVERASGTRVQMVHVDRRAGDPPALVADPAFLKTMLGWKPKYHDLDEIVASALRWERGLTAAVQESSRAGEPQTQAPFLIAG